MPKLHIELWHQYNGHLPDPRALKSYLIIHKEFSDSGAEEFVKEFKSTVAFAKLESDGSISPPDADKEPGNEGETDPMRTETAIQAGQENRTERLPAQAGGQDFKIILTPETLGVRVEAHRELTMREWKKLEKMLLSIKPEDDAE
ncbi:MAG: hypothetical protein M3R04_00650 [bacterium]|nr:hypothetical protein [bacterium]